MEAGHLDGLNPEQRRAVEQTSGPLLVLAGAGSGKTRVLTHRIAHLVDEAGVAPWHILAVTFTNKAAGEMRERIERLVGQDCASRLWIGTFHSICARLLRYEADAFGLHGDFTIYDAEDSRALVRRVLDSLDLAEQDFPPRQVLGEISRAKNAMIDPEEFARGADGNPRRRRLAEVFSAYEEGLRANNAFDFDDLIVEPVRQLQRHEEVLEKWRERWRHILVDEYQDTNRPQYLLTRLLAAEHRNLCVVGDDDQSIYQFRGADIRNILDFEADYPEAVVVRLEQNYRSTSRILAAANAVIGHNLGAQGQEPVDPRRGGPGDPAGRVRRRPRRGAPPRRRRGRPLPRGGAEPLRRGDPLPRQRPVPRSRGGAAAPGHPLCAGGRHPVLRAPGGEGRPRLPAAAGQPGRRHQPPAGDQHPPARHRRPHGGAAGRPRRPQPHQPDAGRPPRRGGPRPRRAGRPGPCRSSPG